VIEQQKQDRQTMNHSWDLWLNFIFTAGLYSWLPLQLLL